eukprot:jgi/Botrbrau1/12211/Bobra.0197s0005.1
MGVSTTLPPSLTPNLSSRASIFGMQLIETCLSCRLRRTWQPKKSLTSPRSWMVNLLFRSSLNHSTRLRSLHMMSRSSTYTRTNRGFSPALFLTYTPASLLQATKPSAHISASSFLCHARGDCFNP